MEGSSRAPSYGEVAADLRTVRDKGAGRLRHLDVPALRQAAVVLDLADADDTEPAPVLTLLREAVDTLGGGSLQEAAEYSLGLARGTALWSSGQRRESAAERFGVVPETFRKKPERDLLGQVAEAVLALCHDAALRRARVAMEERRHPADSRLAVQWVERFEAYYRIWTPVYSLAANIEAALETYTHEPADHAPWQPADDPDAQPYDPSHQARAYSRAALYNVAQYLLELKRFLSRHGGMWLLSDADAEQQAADAIYRIGWHASYEEDDEAFLRRHLADARHEEVDHFWNVIRAFPDGLRIHDDWQTLIQSGAGLTEETDKQHNQAWLLIQACHDYTLLIDEDWMKIADWYRSPRVAADPVAGTQLYRALTRPTIQVPVVQGILTSEATRR